MEMFGGVSSFTYDEKELGFKLCGGTPHPIECKSDLLELVETLLLDSNIDKVVVVVKARGKFLRDLNKSAVVYSKVKGDFKVLPKVGESVRYKNLDLNDPEVYSVLAIDSENSNVVVKHTYKSYGDQVSYFGIPFSEYFKDMKIVHDGEWLKYTDDEDNYLELGLYFDKHKGLYHIGLDDFYHDSITLEKLKLLSEFLVEYIKNEESL